VKASVAVVKEWAVRNQVVPVAVVITAAVEVLSSSLVAVLFNR
jgi:hypothetical protein